MSRCLNAATVPRECMKIWISRMHCCAMISGMSSGPNRSICDRGSSMLSNSIMSGIHANSCYLDVSVCNLFLGVFNMYIFSFHPLNLVSVCNLFHGVFNMCIFSFHPLNLREASWQATPCWNQLRRLRRQTCWAQ